MTTTTDPSWMDALVPKQLRIDGMELLAEFEVWREQSLPLLVRIGDFFRRETDAFGRASVQMLASLDLDDDKVLAGSVDDGFATIFGTATRALALNAGLAAMGVDPDNLPKQEG